MCHWLKLDGSIQFAYAELWVLWLQVDLYPLIQDLWMVFGEFFRIICHHLSLPLAPASPPLSVYPRATFLLLRCTFICHRWLNNSSDAAAKMQTEASRRGRGWLVWRASIFAFWPLPCCSFRSQKLPRLDEMMELQVIRQQWRAWLIRRIHRLHGRTQTPQPNNPNLKS